MIENKTGAVPRGVDNAKVIQVIETRSIVGSGLNQDDICREVIQYWSLEGELIAQSDPINPPKRFL